MIKELNLKFKIKENRHGIKRETIILQYCIKNWSRELRWKALKLGSWKVFWLTSYRDGDTRMDEEKKDLIKADKSKKKLYVHVLLNGQNLKNMLRTG